MAKMNREEFENAVILFERKRLRENKITLLFMDLYVANKGTDEDIKEYSALADNEEYLKDIKLPKPKADGTTTRKGRDVEKIRPWFYKKYSPDYKYEACETTEKVKEPASIKLAMKLNGMKF